MWCSVLPSSRLTPNDTSYEHYTFLFTLVRVTPNEESANTERFHFWLNILRKSLFWKKIKILLKIHGLYYIIEVLKLKYFDRSIYCVQFTKITCRSVLPSKSGVTLLYGTGNELNSKKSNFSILEAEKCNVPLLLTH